MKTRNALVANSSSTAYILDLRKDGVPEFVEDTKQKGIEKPSGLGRSTAIAVGLDVVRYARLWKQSMSKYTTQAGFADWILEWVDKLGEENVVFARNSDEGMGGYLPGPSRDLVETDREYH
jgi:hypothetical protein